MGSPFCRAKSMPPSLCQCFGHMRTACISLCLSVIAIIFGNRGAYVYFGQTPSCHLTWRHYKMSQATHLAGEQMLMM